LATSYNNIGLVYNHLNDYVKALSCCEKALKIRENRLSATHSDVATSYDTIGKIHYNLNDTQ